MGLYHSAYQLKVVRLRQDRVRELYGAGKTQGEIAEILGVGLPSVNYDVARLRERGEIAPRVTPLGRKESAIDKDAVTREWNAGFSPGDIARHQGVSESYMRTLISRLRKEGRDLYPARDPRRCS